MGTKLTDSERVAYIREGNRLFNEGKFKEAEKIFMMTNYRDGILRIANRYYYELKRPLIALKFYYKINAREKIEEIRERMLFAFKKLIRENGENSNQTDIPKTNNREQTFNVEDSTETFEQINHEETTTE